MEPALAGLFIKKSIFLYFYPAILYENHANSSLRYVPRRQKECYLWVIIGGEGKSRVNFGDFFLAFSLLEGHEPSEGTWASHLLIIKS